MVTRRQLFVASLSGPLVGIGGCAVQPPPSIPQGKATPMTGPSFEYLVPDESGVITKFSPSGLVLTGWQRPIPPNLVDMLVVNLKETGGAVERKLQYADGKGWVYAITLLRTESKEAGTIRISLKAQQSVVYQSVYWNPPPPAAMPTFTEQELKTFYLSAWLPYQTEINSEFSPDSVYANFVRLLTPRARREGERDRVTGKIYKHEFFAGLRGAQIPFVIETFPYRNGSKVVVNASLPTLETSPGQCDFRALVREFQQRLQGVVKA